MNQRIESVGGHMAASIRRTFDLSQEEVATEADVSRATLDSFEKGKDHRASTAQKITQALFKLAAARLPAATTPMMRDLGEALRPANEVERKLVAMAIVWFLGEEGEADK